MTPQDIAAAVAKRIREYPEHHSQVDWYISTDPGMPYTSRVGCLPDLPIEDWFCGTTACAAGHAVHVALQAGMEVKSEFIPEAATEVLGIQYTRFDSVPVKTHLFSVGIERAEVLEILDKLASRKDTSCCLASREGSTPC